MIGCFVMPVGIGNSRRKPQERRGIFAIWKNLSGNHTSEIAMRSIESNTSPIRHANANNEQGKEEMTTATRLLNAIDSELATLSRRYNTLALGLKTPGVDVVAIRKMMESISERKMELERQIEFVK